MLNNINLNYKEMWGDQKCILVSKQGNLLEEKKRKKEIKPRYGCLNLCMEIMDFSMILVQELLEYGLLGFQLDINLIPISRVLPGKHSNSRFKGSLVKKP